MVVYRISLDNKFLVLLQANIRVKEHLWERIILVLCTLTAYHDVSDAKEKKNVFRRSDIIMTMICVGGIVNVGVAPRHSFLLILFFSCLTSGIAPKLIFHVPGCSGVEKMERARPQVWAAVKRGVRDRRVVGCVKLWGPFRRNGRTTRGVI